MNFKFDLFEKDKNLLVKIYLISAESFKVLIVAQLEQIT